jgi:hypothetical protein
MIESYGNTTWVHLHKKSFGEKDSHRRSDQIDKPSAYGTYVH